MPSADLADLSPNQVHERVVALVQSPAPASWWDGAETTVEIEVEMPRAACVSETHVWFEVPLQIRSQDGRVDVAGVGSLSAKVADDGSVTHAALSLADRTPVKPEQLAAVGGISGQNFRDSVRRVFWHATIKPVGVPPPAWNFGEVIIEAIDEDGSVGPVRKLLWRNEPVRP